LLLFLALIGDRDKFKSNNYRKSNTEKKLKTNTKDKELIKKIKQKSLRAITICIIKLEEQKPIQRINSLILWQMKSPILYCIIGINNLLHNLGAPISYLPAGLLKDM